jgi:ABC-type multidrug transport system ATPase subunit
MFNQQKSLEEPLLVAGLSKVFRKENKPFFAVNNLTFGVLPTECFGLLGLNGAGKTSTLQILTGKLNPTRGEAYINGFNVETDRLKATRELGFCPQFVSFNNFMSQLSRIRTFFLLIPRTICQNF